MQNTNNIDFRRCATDYAYYAANLLKIKTKRAEIRPLLFNDPQVRLHKLLEHLRQQRRLMRVIVLKARREGISTYSEGRIFWQSHFNENTDSVVIAHEKESGEAIFGMCKLFYEELPTQFRPMVRYSSKKELSFENPDPKDRKRNPGLRSKIEVRTAGKKDVARGGGYVNLHCCLTPDTLVLTPNNRLVPAGLLRPGDMVLDDELKPTQVKNIFEYHGDFPAVQINLWYNPAFPITCTSTHRLLTSRGLVEAGHIKKYDRLLFPVGQITDTLNILPMLTIPRRASDGESYCLGYFLGLFLAEGCFHVNQRGTADQISLTVNRDEVSHVLPYAEMMATLFGCNVHVRPIPGKWAAHIVLSSVELSAVMRSVFGTDKNIPDWFFHLGEPFVRGVTEGYIYGDGYWSDKTCDSVCAYSVRPWTILWLRDALLRLGYGYASVQIGKSHKSTEQDKFVCQLNGDAARRLQAKLPGNASRTFRKAQKREEKWRIIEQGGKKYVAILVKTLKNKTEPVVHDIEIDTSNHLYLLPSCISHNSELGSWTFAEDTVPALIPTIPDTEQSLIVFESTAKGVGNFFHKEWLRAKEGDSNFAPFFLSWFDMSEYTKPFYTAQDKVSFEENLNEEERELRAKFTLTSEQLHWRRSKIADLLGDVEVFRQEYPSTDAEAFIVSGVPIFNRKRLRVMATKCSVPIFRGIITRQGITPEDKGDLRVWRGPEKGATYVMGVDVADGGEGGDYSCIEVLKVLPAPFIAEQVAEWHGHIDPVNLAFQVEFLGKFYNDALASIETNAHGLVTQQELYRNYWNIYQGTAIDRFDQKLVTKLGWETTMKTKQLLVGFMSHCIADLTIIIHSEDLVREFMTFIRTADGSANAASNGYDDRVMAAMVGVFTLHQAIDPDATLERAASTASPLKNTAIVAPPNYIDPEFAYWQRFGHPAKVESEDCWQNY